MEAKYTLIISALALAGMTACASSTGPVRTLSVGSAESTGSHQETGEPAAAPQDVAEPVPLMERTPPNVAVDAPPLESEPEKAEIKESAPVRYVVKQGDTLWGIASAFLAKPWQWPEVWFVNEQVENPHQIFPGDVLSLRTMDGRQQLFREPAGELDTVKLSPSVRTSSLGDAIYALPLEAVKDFLRKPRIIPLEQLNAAPYLLAFGDDQLIAATESPAYAKNVPEQSGDDWSIVRPEREIRDPVDGSLLGYAALPVGEYAVRERHPDGAGTTTGVLGKTAMEARAGDRLVPADAEDFDASFIPRAPDQDIETIIVWIAEERLQATQYQVVAINRGAEHGLAPGHVLTIHQKGRLVNDPYQREPALLPPAAIGTMMIFKAESGMSFGLVMDATRQISMLDSAVTPGFRPTLVPEPQMARRVPR